MKTLFAGLLLLLSFTAMADDCAKNVAALKNLVGNRGLSTDWMENSDKNPYHMVLKDNKDGLQVTLTEAKGLVARFSTIVCRKGDNYVANVKSVVWGEAAPSMVKNKSVSSLKIKIPYQSVMKVSVSIMTLEFNPTK